MPHIVINVYPGRSKAEHQRIADKIAESAAEVFDMPKGKISVSIEEVEQSDWKNFYDTEIYGKRDSLFVEPEYKL